MTSIILNFILIGFIYSVSTDTIENAEPEEHDLVALKHEVFDYFRKNNNRSHYDITKFKICKCSLTSGCTWLTVGLVTSYFDQWPDWKRVLYGDTCITDGECYQYVDHNKTAAKYGCIDRMWRQPRDPVPDDQLLCTNKTRKGSTDELWICCTTDYCNNATALRPTAADLLKDPNLILVSRNKLGWAIFLTAIGLIAIVATHFLLRYFCIRYDQFCTFHERNRRDSLPATVRSRPSDGEVPTSEEQSSRNSCKTASTSQPDTTAAGSTTVIYSQLMKGEREPLTLEHALDTSMGSGGGNTQLQSRTIANEIRLGDIIGGGRFGSVYVGEWWGEQVAVKVFKSSDEHAYDKEVEIYHTRMLRHPNILRYIGNDRFYTGSSVDLWIVFEYHHFGSLYDYLSENTLTLEQFCNIMRSAANGLSYLHATINGVKESTKPSVAHRDLKSRNIMLKHDLTCAIGDLGLSAVVDSNTGTLDSTSAFGTVRYLAPEVLGGNFDTESFEHHKMSDVYSFALVMWEALARTDDFGIVAFEPKEAIPYIEYTRRDPTIEVMRELVYNKHLRPRINDEWITNERFNCVFTVIRESWAESPSARLTAFSIRMRTERIQCEIFGGIKRYGSYVNASKNVQATQSTLVDIPEHDENENKGEIAHYVMSPSAKT